MRLRTLATLGVGFLAGAWVAQARAAAAQVDRQYRSAALLLPDAQLARPMAAIFRRTTPRPAPIVDGVVATDRLVPGRDGRRVRVWTYDPADAGDEPRPALLHIHGGGFIMGDPVTYHDRCSALAAATGVRVVGVDYRLAPEHPFPAGLDDCVDVLRWMHATADAEGIDAARIGVGGDSAGGGLAACVAQVAADEGLPLALQLLIYPMLDDRTRTRIDDRGRYAWPAASNRLSWSRYLSGVGRIADGARRLPPYAAAARRDDLSRLAPAWIGVGDLDLLHAESVAYTERLRNAGVAVELVEVPGAYHAFERLVPSAPGSVAFERALRDAVRVGLG